MDNTLDHVCPSVLPSVQGTDSTYQIEKDNPILSNSFPVNIDPKTVVKPYSNPQTSPLGPYKTKTTPK